MEKFIGNKSVKREIRSVISAEECLRRFEKISLTTQKKYRKLSFGCSTLNDLTGGGLPLRPAITELYGAPGSGKTQVALQLCVSCVKMGLHCGWINTEKKFPIKRLAEMITNIPKMRDPTHLLNRVLVAEVKGAKAVESLLERDLKCFLSRFKFGLLVIDSVAGLFRHLCADYKVRAKVMREFHQQLLSLQRVYNITIICTNQVTSAIDALPILGEPEIIPCLGPVWTEFLTNRFMVIKTHRKAAQSNLSVRYLMATFSPYIPSDQKAYFVVETAGLESFE